MSSTNFSKSKECLVKQQPRSPRGLRISDSPFIVLDYLCGGAFGVIHVGVNERTQQRVAIKLEEKNADKAQLYLEFGFYIKLESNTSIFLPKIYFFGSCNTWNALVMEILGPSLLAMFRKMEPQCFSIRTIAALGLRLMEIIQYVHFHGLIYRDIKPENFLLGLPYTDHAYNVYLIDLGLCKEWRLENGEHIPFQQGKCITGTITYMSTNMHFGYELSRRDDLEAILYMLIFLHKGVLPWQELPKELIPTIPLQILRIGELKATIPSNKLCSAMSEDFEYILKRVKALDFSECPAYHDYIEHFLNMLSWDRTSSIDLSLAFDWDQTHRPRFYSSQISSYRSITGTSRRFQNNTSQTNNQSTRKVSRFTSSQNNFKKGNHHRRYHQ